MSFYDQGMEAMKNKDYEKAIEYFSKSVENMENPKAAEMLKKAKEERGDEINKLGDKLYKNKKYKEAVDYYLESVKLEMEAGNEKKANNYREELRKATEQLAEQINKEGDNLMKKKDYEKAINTYEESVNLMKAAQNEKRLLNFLNEFKNAIMKRVDELIDEAKKLAEDERLEEALKKVEYAKKLAEKSQDDAFKNSIKKVILEVYEIAADKYNKKGDNAFKKKLWADAIKYYDKSVDLIKKAQNQKKLENYSKELAKAFQENAEAINKEGDKAFKDGNYELAIEIYQESVEVARNAKNESLVKNFEKELEKSFEMLAKKVNEEGDKLFKAKNYEEAGKLYIKSIELAEKSKKESLVKNFTNELRKTYETWAKETNEQADKLLEKNEFEKAIEMYKKSIEIAETLGDEKIQEKYGKELIKAYTQWAESINKQGDIAFKTKDYKKAYELYQKSVEIAELTQDKGLIKNFQKERDKALSMLQ